MTNHGDHIINNGMMRVGARVDGTVVPATCGAKQVKYARVSRHRQDL